MQNLPLSNLRRRWILEWSAARHQHQQCRQHSWDSTAAAAFTSRNSSFGERCSYDSAASYSHDFIPRTTTSMQSLALSCMRSWVCHEDELRAAHSSKAAAFTSESTPRRYQAFARVKFICPSASSNSNLISRATTSMQNLPLSCVRRGWRWSTSAHQQQQPPIHDESAAADFWFVSESFPSNDDPVLQLRKLQSSGWLQGVLENLRLHLQLMRLVERIVNNYYWINSSVYSWISLTCLYCKYIYIYIHRHHELTWLYLIYCFTNKAVSSILKGFVSFDHAVVTPLHLNFMPHGHSWHELSLKWSSNKWYCFRIKCLSELHDFIFTKYILCDLSLCFTKKV